MAHHFPLAPVLRVRELAAEQEEQTLGRIQTEIERLRQAIRETELSLRKASAAREQGLHSMALAAMHLHASYAADQELRTRGDFLRQQLARFEQLRIQQIARYQAAYRRREVLVSLRASDREAWERARSRQEEKAADEAFLARRLRDRE